MLIQEIGVLGELVDASHHKADVLFQENVCAQVKVIECLPLVNAKMVWEKGKRE